MTFKTPLMGAVSAIALVLTAPAFAQDAEADTQAKTQAETAAPETPQIAAEDVTDAQVEGFVAALIAVEAVQAEYMPRIQEQETQEGAEELVQEANEAAKTAVSDVTDMTPETFRAISAAAQQDQDLNQRIVARIKEVRTQ
ncbi:DUF4168 domain-containing protein [Roseovarius sp. MMSF_3281]|uniref:DUF4168 domain-containing protein n=1 Tax=Roseovarius sp. MMSF_3281 TaxID=3046694 RepID=UPI00273E5F3C|nr:DUF4168 domain-containing protein [Roseovarius sp. MMSF_3281]